MNLDADIHDREKKKFQLTRDNLTAVNVISASAFIPAEYDNIQLSYTGSNLTGVVYKKGTTTLSTLILGYDGNNNLISVTRS